MGKPAIEVCRTEPGRSHVNTLCLCACAGPLLEKAKTNKFKSGASGEQVKQLHEHLKKFNFDLELSDSRKDPPVESDDVAHGKWGDHTTRALRMFAKHPQVNQEPENIIETDGKELTEAVANKICQWCSAGVASPKNYWEFKQLSVSDGKTQVIDAHGDDLGKGKQSAWHHHIKQIQEDLSKTGFGVHKDDLCEIGKDYKADGEWWTAPLTTRTTNGKGGPLNKREDKQVHIDKSLRDLSYLTKKFQRQAAWVWRMKKDGTHLPDVSPGDPTHYGGSETGIMDEATAKVLHAWASNDLHMVIGKFELKDLHWPPDSGTAVTLDQGSTTAQLRSDAYDQWVAATKDVYAKHATIQGPYSSSPRGWHGGKQSVEPGKKNANSPYSWHYVGLGVDISQALAAGDGTMLINDKHNWVYILEEDGNRFRIWCWVNPQPAVPADPKDDKTDPLVQYRNRNIGNGPDHKHPVVRIVDPKKPSDPAPLRHMQDDAHTVRAAKPGWYVDVTRILEDNQMKRIARHSDWASNDKGWEWWHYQFAPPKPAWLNGDFTFGEYLQFIGVHEYSLRNVHDGWPAHEDIGKDPG